MSEEVEVIHEDTQPVQPITGEHAPVRVARQGGGLGCWIPAIITGFIAGILLIAGALLPPVNLAQRLFGVSLFGPSYTMLSAESNAVRTTDGGLTLVVDPADPGQGFGVALGGVPQEQFSAGSAQNAAWVPEAAASLPANVALISPVYTFDVTGGQPDAVTLSVNVPAEAAANPDILDLYAWDDTSGTWAFVPADKSVSGTLTARVNDVPETLGLFQAAPAAQPSVLVAVDATQVLSPEVGQLATIVSPGGMQPTLDGKLTGSLAPGYDPNAGYLVMPVIRNFADARALDSNTVGLILNNRTLRNEHVTQIVGFAANNNFAGVMIDYREVPPDQRDSFSAFIRALGAAFDERGLLLGVVVPAAVNNTGTWDTGGYDWRALGAAADYVQIDLGLDPSAFAPGPDRIVEAMLRWGVGEVSRYKLLLGLSAQSVRQVAADFTTVGFRDALSALGDVTVEADNTSEAGTVPPGSEIQASLDGFQASAGTDTIIGSAFIDFLGDDGSPISRVWLTTPDALRFRMNAGAPFGIGGVAFEDLLAEGLADNTLEAVMNYKLGLPAPSSPVDLALRWRIEGATGLLSEIVTGLNEGLVTTLEAPDGNYAINVDVVSGDAQVPRSGAAVALFAPTLTPTPAPTATPTPTPTPTPLPQAAPVIAAPAGPAPAGPGAGSIGGFEYGGHVTNPASESAAAAMRRAGMSWMKVQIRYNAGSGPGFVAGQINDAKARGFKILLGVVGYPNELASGGAGYVQQFAQFLGGVAALGPDAIEVWNEPNIDREWPRGQISGATYADMLRQSYQAIKGANGGVLVISGAPAPTGAEAAFPGQVMNDDRWLREVVAAGGLNYVDCVGAHYNEGIVGPDQMSGDPRDGYYTRYFGGMLDTYWNIIGGAKPICWTELGYLTPEGFPPLDPYFGWAQNTSLAQQASWLAGAAARSAQSGRVRLMIVWNVDFSNYGADPMAGYAMIRPNGGCPACDALAAAR